MSKFIPRSRNVLRKPTYSESPEAVMGREFAAFTPWKVDCTVYENMLDCEGKKFCIFVRAQNPARAMHVARKLWAVRIKERNLRSGQEVPEWPKLDDQHPVECLDDSDYMHMWKAAQLHPRFWLGDVKNPFAFAFFPK
jgi:hypothetical protein